MLSTARVIINFIYNIEYLGMFILNTILTFYGEKVQLTHGYEHLRPLPLIHSNMKNTQEHLILTPLIHVNSTSMN